jgi:hypothetical protein
MSSSTSPSPEEDAHRGPVVRRRLTELPRQPLPRGGGSTRDVWSEPGPDGEPAWTLQLVELRGQSGALGTPADSEQLTVGLSGPQVTIAGAGRGIRLRRGQPLRHRAATVEYRRPLVRTSGPSRVLTLSYRPELVEPEFAFDTMDGVVALPPDTRVAIVLQGELRYEGVQIPPDAALVLGGGSRRLATSAAARLLILRVPSPPR